MSGIAYYGMSRNTFDKNECREDDCYPGRDHKETLSRLRYLATLKGIGLITARPGLGKSYTVRCFIKGLSANLHRVEYMCLTTVSVPDFYREFCKVLGVSEKGGKAGMFKAIQEQIWYLYKEKGQPLLLVIDEAQYLQTGVLNDIKMLMNQKYDSLNCFTLVLCGEPYLRDTLKRPVHEALNQRILVKYNYKGLDNKEVSEYIKHKIVRGGGSSTIINEAAINAVNGYVHGNPRLIDNLMQDALNIGEQQRKQVIDEEIIMAAVMNQNPFKEE